MSLGERSCREKKISWTLRSSEWVGLGVCAGMSSKRPDGTPAPAPEDVASDADVAAAAAHFLFVSQGHSDEQHLAQTLRRLAAVSAPPDVPLRHVDRTRFASTANAPAPAQPARPARAEPAEAPDAPDAPEEEHVAAAPPRAAGGPSVAEHMAAVRAAMKTSPATPSAGSAGASAAVQRPTRTGNPLRAPPAPAAPLSTAVASPAPRLDAPPVATGNLFRFLDDDVAAADAPADPAEGVVDEPAVRPQRLAEEAFVRRAESESNVLVNEDADDWYMLPDMILRDCPEMDYLRTDWVRAPAFVEGFDCVCVRGKTDAERLGTMRTPTVAEFESIEKDFRDRIEPAHKDAHARWVKGFKAMWPDLWALLDDFHAKNEQVLGLATDVASAVTAADAPLSMAPSAVHTALELEELLTSLASTGIRCPTDVKSDACTRLAEAGKKLTEYVSEHFDELAEVGRAEPVLEKPPARLQEMAAMRVPPTMTHNVRYIGLRAHMHHFMTALREQHDAHPADPWADASAALLAQWLTSRSHRTLKKLRNDGMELLSDADVIHNGYKSKELDDVMDRMQKCMPCAMEEDAQAFERTSVLVQYLLATCFDYTGEEPRPVPGNKAVNSKGVEDDEGLEALLEAADKAAPWATYMSNKYTWTTVQTYLEEHVLPFVARLLLGEGEAAQAVGVARAPGVVPFQQWLASLESEYVFEPPPFAETLKAMIADVEEMKATKKPVKADWGTKTELNWARRAFAARLEAAQ